MSIVLAVKSKTNDNVVIASDSQTSFGDFKTISDTGRKLIKAGNNIIGLAGWGIYSNLLRLYLQENSLVANSEIQVFEFFVKFWKAIKSDYNYVSDQSSPDLNSPFAELDSTFIVATPESIFYVADDMSVIEFDNFYAIGSGSLVALGALQVMYDEGYSTEEMARRAVETAIALDNNCGGKVNMESL